MQISIIVFPGSNCDRDMETAVERISGKAPHLCWHGESALPQNTDIVILPGGFSYGDYLRSGAIAARSPIMRAVKDFADKGGYVFGVCNGFQILTEAGLLPGTLMRNRDLKFICKNVQLKIANSDSAFTKAYDASSILSIPVAHHDGNYFADETTLKTLQDHNQVAFHYCDANGALSKESNPNGSQHNIAGVLSENKRILGMMPHPERATEALTGGTDGIKLFTSLLAA